MGIFSPKPTHHFRKAQHWGGRKWFRAWPDFLALVFHNPRFLPARLDFFTGQGRVERFRNPSHRLRPTPGGMVCRGGLRPLGRQRPVPVRGHEARSCWRQSQPGAPQTPQKAVSNITWPDALLAIRERGLDRQKKRSEQRAQENSQERRTRPQRRWVFS